MSVLIKFIIWICFNKVATRVKCVHVLAVALCHGGTPIYIQYITQYADRRMVYIIISEILKENSMWWIAEKNDCNNTVLRRSVCCQEKTSK